ncbi:MAG: hypothetical protein IPL58_16700 [Betaproteobacteria bacterium]|uniref:Uncharacterized protein n=1 Tax=Candidatus Proximibacter danicus TaxID=2954365 RepID=A0A9D7PU94_9PROT|nr:hypothetical protein [Candidatus Proximibacter danicus]
MPFATLLQRRHWPSPTLPAPSPPVSNSTSMPPALAVASSSHRDLAIDLGGKLDNTGEITANRNARINVGGTLDNSGTLQAGTTLAVTAGSIDNRASGELLAPNSA